MNQDISTQTQIRLPVNVPGLTSLIRVTLNRSEQNSSEVPYQLLVDYFFNHPHTDKYVGVDLDHIRKQFNSIAYEVLEFHLNQFVYNQESIRSSTNIPYPCGNLAIDKQLVRLTHFCTYWVAMNRGNLIKLLELMFGYMDILKECLPAEYTTGYVDKVFKSVNNPVYEPQFQYLEMITATMKYVAEVKFT